MESERILSFKSRRSMLGNMVTMHQVGLARLGGPADLQRSSNTKINGIISSFNSGPTLLGSVHLFFMHCCSKYLSSTIGCKGGVQRTSSSFHQALPRLLGTPSKDATLRRISSLPPPQTCLDPMQEVTIEDYATAMPGNCILPVNFPMSFLCIIYFVS